MTKDLCPICNNKMQSVSFPHYSDKVHFASDFLEKMCHHPSVKDPLHYYYELYDVANIRNKLCFQEFNIEVCDNYVLFQIDHWADKSFLHVSPRKPSIEIDGALKPDFPKLETVINKIKIMLVWS